MILEELFYVPIVFEYPMTSVADPLHFDADLDPAFRFDADPDPDPDLAPKMTRIHNTAHDCINR
jgi:hypothetical protein